MIKIIYHGNCTDGFCGAFLFWLKYGDDAEYIPMNYGTLLDLSRFDESDEVYIVDFSFDRDTTFLLANHVAKLVVLEHHKTAKEALTNHHWPSNTTIIFDMEHSGACIAHEYLHPGINVPLMIKFIEDRDLWKFELKYSKEISAFIQTLPWDFEYWKVIFETFNANSTRYVPLGEAILTKLNQQIEQAVRHAIPVRMLGYRVYAVNSTVNFSEVAGELAKKGHFGVAWFLRSDGQYQYSLRSVGDFDVSEVAKQFGGGGHKNAAGFESDELIFNYVFQPMNLVGKTIKVGDKLTQSGYVTVFGYDPVGVNSLAHSSGTSVPHFVVYESTEDGERLQTMHFNITEDEMEGILDESGCVC